MIIGYVLLLIALAEVIVGLRFIVVYQKRQSVIWYGLFCLGVGTYVAANGIGFITDDSLGQLAEHMAWLGGALATAFFLPFSKSFPLPRWELSESLPWVLWPLALFIPGFLWTEEFIKRQAIIKFGSGYTTDAGPLLWFFLLFFAVYWLWSIVNLVVSLRQADGIHRLQLRVLLAGLLFSLLISAIFDIVMPLTSVTRMAYVGSLLTSAWLGVTTYIIMKRT